MSIPSSDAVGDMQREIVDIIEKAGMIPRSSLEALKTAVSLPTFGGGAGVATFAKLHHDHYQRLCAVLDAARTGNPMLVRLAVEHQDRYGVGPEPDAGR